jgi:hypothetical protein
VADARQQQYQPQIAQVEPQQSIVQQQTTPQLPLSPVTSQPPISVDGLSNEVPPLQQFKSIDSSSTASDVQAVNLANAHQLPEIDDVAPPQTTIEPQPLNDRLATPINQSKAEDAPIGAISGSYMASSPSADQVSTPLPSAQNVQVELQPPISSPVFDIQQGLGS